VRRSAGLTCTPERPRLEHSLLVFADTGGDGTELPVGTAARRAAATYTPAPSIARRSTRRGHGLGGSRRSRGSIIPMRLRISTGRPRVITTIRATASQLLAEPGHQKRGFDAGDFNCGRRHQANTRTLPQTISSGRLFFLFFRNAHTAFALIDIPAEAGAVQGCVTRRRS